MLTLTMLALLAVQPPTTQQVAGTYQGTLKAGPIELRLGFQIARRDDGSYAGTMDSIDQGARGIPLTKAELKDGTLTLAIAGATFTGTPQPTGYAGTWKQGGQEFPLVLSRVEKISEIDRPQKPKPPFPYASSDVTVENAGAKVTLAGTLVTPQGDGPFPAVLLVTGSGPQDRDETIFGHKPFLLIADHLARKGVASLRVDDRGIGKSTGSFAGSTTFDFVTDATACTKFLMKQPKIDSKRVGIVGHSEGAVVAPLVVAELPGVAFLALLAGPALPGDEVIMLQVKAALEAAEQPAKKIEHALAIQRRVLDRAKQSADKAKVLELAKEFDEAGDEPAGTAVRGQAATLVSPWYRTFITHDPRPSLQKLRIPTLMIWGDRDTQIPPAAHRPAAEAALRDTKATFAILPGLNHLFQPCKTGAVSEYAQISTTIAPELLDRLTGWIAEQK